MINLKTPFNNQFYQRDSKNNALVNFSGSVDLPSKLTVKLNDKILYEENLKGNFNLNKFCKQGIYKAEFSINNIVQETVIFIVGRVFLCTGHSFAEGVGSSFVNSDNVFIQANIEGAVPGLNNFTTDQPIIKKIKDYAIMDTNGSKTAGIWGQLAENLSKKDNCPVLIYHSSWGGTSVKQWAMAVNNLRPDSYAGFNSINPVDCPYYKTRNILKHLIKNTGLEAVLIMHGENDTNDTSDNIINNYKTVINAMRNDANVPDLPVYVSRSTWRSDTTKKVIKAQNEVINQVKFVYPGPDLTTIGDEGRKVINYLMPGNNDEHLNANGEKQAAKIWADSIKDYHNNTVVEIVSQNIPVLVIGGSTANIQKSNVLGSVLIFALLIFISIKTKFGVLGVVGSLFIALSVYVSKIFNPIKK